METAVKNHIVYFGVKKIELREKEGVQMIEALAAIAIIIGLLNLLIIAVILIKNLFDFL
jgi:hypothetical protein